MICLCIDAVLLRPQETDILVDSIVVCIFSLVRLLVRVCAHLLSALSLSPLVEMRRLSDVQTRISQATAAERKEANIHRQKCFLGIRFFLRV